MLPSSLSVTTRLPSSFAPTCHACRESSKHRPVTIPTTESLAPRYYCGTFAAGAATLRARGAPAPAPCWGWDSGGCRQPEQKGRLCASHVDSMPFLSNDGSLSSHYRGRKAVSCMLRCIWPSHSFHRSDRAYHLRDPVTGSPERRGNGSHRVLANDIPAVLMRQSVPSAGSKRRRSNQPACLVCSSRLLSLAEEQTSIEAGARIRCKVRPACGCDAALQEGRLVASALAVKPSVPLPGLLVVGLFRNRLRYIVGSVTARQRSYVGHAGFSAEESSLSSVS